MKTIRFLAAVLTVLSCQSSFAYLTMGESGEIHRPGSYLIGAEPQILLNEGGGVVAGGFLDQPLREDMSMRYSLGFGKIDFHAGIAFKYIPFPDIDRQPAIGLKTAVWFARQGDQNVTTVQLAPLFSKKLDTEKALYIPYVAVPFSFINNKEGSHNGTQFVLGTDFRHKDAPDVFFSAEVALNLKDSYSYISGTVSIPFDSEKGFNLNSNQ